MSPRTDIRRIAIAVRNAETAKTIYEPVLGGRFLVPECGVSDAVILLECRRGDADPIVELVQPKRHDGAIARFIRKRGEGLHHLSRRVPDLAAAVSAVESAGGQIVRATSYYRSREGGLLREAFVHPKDAHGILFHLFEDEAGG